MKWNIPYKMISLSDMNSTVKRYFSYSIPEDINDADNRLSSGFSQMKQRNGENLPEGLSFN